MTAAALLALATRRPDGVLAPELAAELLAPLCCDTRAHVRTLVALVARAHVRRRGLVLLDGLGDDAEGRPERAVGVEAEAEPGVALGVARRAGHAAAATVAPAPDLRRWHALYRARRHAGDHGPTTGERMEAYARLAPSLAEEPCRRALRQAGIAAADVVHLVTVSCTGFFAPGLDAELVQRLDLPETVTRTHVGFMGCHGLVNGMRVAQALAPSGPVLLAAVELCSLHLQYGWDEGQLAPAALFADGAAALVLARARPPFAGEPARAPWPHLLATGTCRLPGTAGAMTWTIGDHGFRMTLSRRVPALVGAHLRPWLQRWLERQGLLLQDVGGWAVHPGGPAVLDQVERALLLPPHALQPSRDVLAAHGNMSSPTIAFVLQELAASAVPRPWVVLAFGPGLVVEAALLGDETRSPTGAPP